MRLFHRSRMVLQVWSLMLVMAVLGCARQQAGSSAEPMVPLPKPPIVFAESFDQIDPEVWHEFELKGKTLYQVVEVDGNHVLKAESHAKASILLHSCRFNPTDYPWLSWRWRVDQFVDGENLRTRAGSDTPARIYVYFETPGLPWQKRNIDYLWSAMVLADTLLTSPFANTSKLMVVESGTTRGVWRSVTRNLADDFRRCFGQHPTNVIAIGLMTDTDSTGHDALAYFDDVQVRRDAPPAAMSVHASAR